MKKRITEFLIMFCCLYPLAAFSCSKTTKTRPQPTTAPTRPGVSAPGSQSTSSIVTPVSVATARPSTRPTSFTQATPASTPRSSGITTTKTPYVRHYDCIFVYILFNTKIDTHLLLFTINWNILKASANT